MKDQEGLLTMMERGEFVSTKVRNTRTMRANIVIFATSNGTERLSKPSLSSNEVNSYLHMISNIQWVNNYIIPVVTPNLVSMDYHI